MKFVLIFAMAITFRSVTCFNFFDDSLERGANPSTCVSNDDTIDSGGDNCAWYADYQSQCGDYDTADFTANEQCCECCDNDYSFNDEFGDSCDWYYDYRDECGDYDTANFVANEMCCACASSDQKDYSDGDGSNTGNTFLDLLYRIFVIMEMFGW